MTRADRQLKPPVKFINGFSLIPHQTGPYEYLWIVTDARGKEVFESWDKKQAIQYAEERKDERGARLQRNKRYERNRSR